MRVRRVPQRTCVGCRLVKDKKELVRIVRDPQGQVRVDPTGRAAGRGAYLCPSTQCLDEAVKWKRLDRALERQVDPQLLDELRLQLAEPQR